MKGHLGLTLTLRVRQPLHAQEFLVRLLLPSPCLLACTYFGGFLVEVLANVSLRCFLGVLLSTTGSGGRDVLGAATGFESSDKGVGARVDELLLPGNLGLDGVGSPRISHGATHVTGVRGKLVLGKLIDWWPYVRKSFPGSPKSKGDEQGL